jgi:hypothetical protein
MAFTALVDDMGVDNVGFLIENLGADAAPLQYLRELVQNELEAIERAGISEGQIEIDYEEVKGVRKLRISGNGIGMTADEVAANINHLSASGGVQAFDKNFGIGAKITAAVRNPHGVMYKTWRKGEAALTIMGRVDGRYGRMGFTQPDGTVDYWIPLAADENPPIIQEHGVSVVLLGYGDDDDTTVPPPGTDLPSQWVAAYLERRYFQLRESISLRVLRPVEIYDTEKGTYRSIYDTIRGQRYYLDKHSDSHDRVQLPEVKATVWWWLLGDEITKGGKTWNNRGHVAALYQDELYEVRSGASRTSALKDFGVYAGFGRIVMYVEPHNVLKANTARTELILRGNKPVDYVEIGDAFVSKMPTELEAFMAGQVSTEPGDHRKAIRKNLKEVEDALEEARYRRSKSGKLEHLEPLEGGSPASTLESLTKSEELADRHRREDAVGRVGDEYLRKAREERERRVRGERVEADPAPKIVWDEHGTDVPAGRAATYNPRVHIVTASAKFEFYLDMVEWAVEEARQRAASDIMSDAMRSIVVDEVRRWFEEALSNAVVMLRPMSHDAKWGPMVFQTGLSDEGLTSAVTSHRWLMMSAIKRGLSGRLGKQRDTVVA